MPIPIATRRLTDRDLDILESLDGGPLTARQLLKLSRTFPAPFTDERRVRERLSALTAAGRVRRWLYATAGPGAPAYYTLTRLGHRLLRGADALHPGRQAFQPVGVAQQFHTHALAEFFVHTVVAAHAAGIEVSGLSRDHALRLTTGSDTVIPDAMLRFRLATGGEFTYYVEIDCASERIRSPSTAVSWEHKIRLYEQLQDASADRFRVLAVVARSPTRVGRILGVAATLAKNPRRGLVYGIALGEFMKAEEPLGTPIFRDHMDRAAALLPIRTEQGDRMTTLVR
jgi:DNA-binding HxlR family transcriptional regulator